MNVSSVMNFVRCSSVTRDVAVKLLLLVGTLVVNAILIVTLGLSFPVADAVRPLFISTILCAGALYYLRKREDGFVMCLVSLAFMVAFTSAYTVLMYSVAAINRPLADSYLLRFDQLCSIRIDHIFAWSRQHPYVGAPLAIAYSTVIYQTTATVVVLGFTEQRRQLEGFVLQFMLATLTSAAFFVILPADGPFVTYGYEPNAAQTRFLNDFHAMRSAERSLVTWRNAEGLITCPSFHTTWAILLAWAFRKQRLLKWPMLLLNVAVVASTMTTGWHYFSDVLAGAILGIVAIAVVTQMEPWLYDGDGTSRRLRMNG